VALKLSVASVVWGSGIALASLIGYCVIMGYHRDFQLMLVVAAVRLAVGYGLGLGVASLLAIVMLIRRQPQVGASTLKMTLFLGSITVTGLVVFNLVDSL
jgi:hypothetical protein